MTTIKALLLFVAGLTLVHWSEVRACSCLPGATLDQQYNNAHNVLVAKISGCAPSYLGEDGYCRQHHWTFETIENLKGSNAYVLVQRDEGGWNTCDMSLKVGETYLLFLREGRTYLQRHDGAER